MFATLSQMLHSFDLMSTYFLLINHLNVIRMDAAAAWNRQAENFLRHLDSLAVGDAQGYSL